MENEFSPEQIMQQVEKQLKDEFANLWEENRPALESWAQIIAKLLLKKAAGKNSITINFSIAYAYIGIKLLKARLQYKVESTTIKIIEKTLSIILDSGLKAAAAYAAGINK